MAAREDEVSKVPGDARVSAPWGWAVGLACVAGALLAIRLDLPGFYDNEGRYAEVAREMTLRGDYITPTLDFLLFLNKPPLLYWLAALFFRVAGPSEWARLVPIGAAVVTLIATCRLGARFFGERLGLLAGVLLATSFGFALEARTLRPDGLVIAAVTSALYCWLRAEDAGPGRTRWLLAMYAVLGVGMLAKGLVPAAVVAIPVVLLTVRRSGWRGLGRLRPRAGLAVVAAIVLPWHVAVGVRHQGFAWDYVVNQHLLFFFDKKLPRDSVGDSLGFFWGAFVARTLPWILLVPFTARAALAGLRPDADVPARGTAMCWVWASGVLLLFSSTPARLEHYTLPAAPAVALLAARGVGLLETGALGRAAWRWLAGCAAAVIVVGAVAVAAGRTILERSSWIPEVPELLGFVPLAGLVFLAGGTLTGWAAIRQRPALLAGAMVTVAVPTIVIVLRAEIAAEPLFSWRPVARVIATAAPSGAEIVFEAPTEYQQVGGLAYYTGRRITLLEVPGYAPPTYLVGIDGEMFLSRQDFWRRWQIGRPLVLVSDPERHRSTPQEILSAPSRVLARFGDRWVLANFPG